MEKGQFSNAPPPYQPLQSDPPATAYPPQQPQQPHPCYPGPQQPPGPGYAPQVQQPGYGAPPQQHGGPYAPPQPMMQSSQQSNTTVVCMQQPQTVTTNVMFPPHDYMGLSIFSCLCCFWPVGLIAIIFSSQVSGLYTAGNYGEAAATALRARNCAYLSIILGILALFAVTVILLLY